MSPLDAAERTQRPRAVAERSTSPFGWVLGLCAGVAGFLLSGWLLAVVIEWIGLVWWWQEEGIDHAQRAMAQEIAFLGGDFQQSLLGSHPAVFAKRCADSVYYWVFEWTGLMDALHRLEHPPGDTGGMRVTWHNLYRAVEPFVAVAVIVTQTYVLRVAVLILSLPLFVLFGVVGFAEGLMRRDLRRWGGGRESSFAHGAARLALKPLLMAPWLVYLSLPFSLHPSWIILPASVGFGMALCVVSSTFKKYL